MQLFQSSFFLQIKCPSDQFKCSSGRCIVPNAVCDGDLDCEHGDDEADCGQSRKKIFEEFLGVFWVFIDAPLKSIKFASVLVNRELDFYFDSAIIIIQLPVFITSTACNNFYLPVCYWSISALRANFIPVVVCPGNTSFPEFSFFLPLLYYRFYPCYITAFTLATLPLSRKGALCQNRRSLPVSIGRLRAAQQGVWQQHWLLGWHRRRNGLR